MFIFRRKRFALILCSLFISFSFCLANNTTNQRSYEIQQVSALPVDSKVIVVDAGHGRR